MNMFFMLFANLMPFLYSTSKKPLWVFINSPGGDIFQGLAIHDFFKALRNHGIEINIVGMGLVASMAVSILQAGTRRYAFPNTQFTVHQASLTGGGDRQQEVNEVVEQAKELERLNEIVLETIDERSGMNMEELKRLSKKTDYSVSAESAKRFGPNGLIDEIVTTFPFSLNG